MRRRHVRVAAALVLPIGGAATAVAYRSGGGAVAAVCAVSMLATGIALALRSMRTLGTIPFLRRLNAEVAEFEDSIELALDDGVTTGPSIPATELRELQRARLRRRLETTALPDLRPPVPWLKIAVTWAAAASISLACLFAAPLRHSLRGRATAMRDVASLGAIAGRLRITPPAYTKLPAYDVDSLDAKVPAGSTIGFELRLAAAPASAMLSFDDGAGLDLRREGEEWRGTRVMLESALYRVRTADGATAADAPHRIEILPDQAPQIVVHLPQRSLTVSTPGQKSWDLDFEATDDYGLGPASLEVTLAQGSGENIKSSERSIAFEGSGDVRHRIYRKSLDLAALGFAVGNDLIVRLDVSDNHPAPAHVSRSASFILRWPAPAAAVSAGMEGVVQQTLPAYFSSERQLIIDTEALIAERSNLAAQKLAARADDLGVQQKVLRLRYGQFLGEEFENAAEHAPSAKPSLDLGNTALQALPPESADAPPKARTFGGEGNTAGEYGHVHDKPEAATLLDPDTRRLLKLAIDQMWQAELNLRQTGLEPALPFEYKALDYIKQVQQAERIYLARAGVRLPQVDATRRLSGDRTGLGDRSLALTRAADDDAPVRGFRDRLEHRETPDWAAFIRWVRQHRSQLPDTLGLMSAIDRAQHQPQCATCRASLEDALWPLLRQPPSALTFRPSADAAGAAYLEALTPAAAAPP